MTKHAKYSSPTAQNQVGKCYEMEMNVENKRKPFPAQIMIHRQQLENVKYFNCLGSMRTTDARCTREIKSRIANAKAALNNKEDLSTSKLDLNLRNTTRKCCISSSTLYDAETWTLRKVDHKYF